jgi:uncharacterized protein YdbL (DUF1318 family)
MRSFSAGLTRRNLLALALGAAFLPLVRMSAAQAQDLDAARQAGYVGERPDGYIGQVDPAAPAWAVQLVGTVNAERRQKYVELAESNGTSVEAVQVVAAQKIIDRLPAGSYYMDSGGAWVQK